MNQCRLLLIVGEREWTMTAVHLACAMSRRNQTEVVLLNMMPVRHPLLLGTDASDLLFTAVDAATLAEMAATAEDYGVPLTVHRFAYANYWPAIVDAAEQLNVTAVIAHIPPSPLPYWTQIRRWWLQRQLTHHHQQLLTLEDLTPSLTWTPSITWQPTTTPTKRRPHHTP